uniref:Uncharacterized protein n=1 Tax=Tetranychus urticae TaxID=32264 RepID=T1K2Y1_TETUR
MDVADTVIGQVKDYLGEKVHLKPFND